MIVMKFGGSSVGNAERIKEVINIVKGKINQKPVVVVSAIKGTTDLLIDIANKAFQNEDYNSNFVELRKKHNDILDGLGLVKDLVDNELDDFKNLVKRIAIVRQVTTETLDHVQSFGERMSSKIVAAYMNSINLKAEAHNAYDMGMITNPDFGNAEPMSHAPELLKKNLYDLDYVPVITGFIGMTNKGHITTLGRGGSDYTAAIIGSALDMDEIQIWTDVDGIMTSDPRIVKNAQSIENISFEEAAELSYFGAKVLHPKTILPAVKKNIPVRVLNTYNPSHPGTVIVSKSQKSDNVVKGIACKKGVNLISIHSTRMLDAYGFLAKVFDIFAEYSISIDMIATSEVNISLTVDKIDNLGKAVKELETFADVKVDSGKAIICVVGEGLKANSDVAVNIFRSVAENNIDIEMISQGASEINISFIVDEKDADKVVISLHDKIFV